MATRPLDQRTILICGAGIGGLTTALALARQGLRALVFEQSAEPSEFGAGIQLSPNASRILMDLGLETGLTAHWTLPETIRIFHGPKAEILNTVPLGDAAQQRYGAPYAVIHRADLLQVLLDACSASPDIEILYGHRIDEFAAHPRGVTIQTSTVEEFPGIGLIGADGLHSEMRKRLLNDGPPQKAALAAWRGMVSVQKTPGAIDNRATCLWLSRNFHVVHYPVRKGRWVNIVAIQKSSADHSGWSSPGDPDELLARAKSAPAQLQELLGAVNEWHVWSLYDRPPAKYISDGTVALVGDAAHPILPFLAQGGAQAIEDAAAIAEALADTDGNVPTAFRLYENRRMSRTARVWKESRNNARIYHFGFPLAYFRNKRIRETQPEDLLTRYDWLYGGG